MLKVEQLYDDLLLVTDDCYYLNRYPIILNFLEKRELEVLDYHIKITHELTNILMGSEYDVTPVNLDISFDKLLNELNDNANGDDDIDINDMKFELTLLVQKKKDN